MLLTDLRLLVCPACGHDLRLGEPATVRDGYVLDGHVDCIECPRMYPVVFGIPRFIADVAGYNPTWNYKWNVLDRGRALNHYILDKRNPAYQLHDIYDRNSHDGAAFASMRGRLALEIGCGVGQYVLKSLFEHQPAKIVALDLTEGVDTLRRVVAQRHATLLSRILFVQASVFSMPFRPGSFDYVYSLGVLHHTGDTRGAIRAAAALVREGGELNIWVYAAPAYHLDTREPGRADLSAWMPLARIVYERLRSRLWYGLFSRMSVTQASRLLQPFASEAWYRLSTTPVLRILPRLVMPPPPHPDRDYRLINLFDGYVNRWAENWVEPELFPVLRDAGIVVKGISAWRLGFWGVKDSAYYVTMHDSPRSAAHGSGRGLPEHHGA
jgi:SAM-dependent methyltransferase